MTPRKIYSEYLERAKKEYGEGSPTYNYVKMVYETNITRRRLKGKWNFKKLLKKEK